MKIAGEITRKQIEAAKQRIFRKEAWLNVRDHHVLGMLLSQTLGGDGYAILQACSTALEDANFHRENDQLQKLFPHVFSKKAFA